MLFICYSYAIHMLFSCRVIKHIFIIITITLYIYFIITEIPHFKPMKNKIKKPKFPSLVLINQITHDLDEWIVINPPKKTSNNHIAIILTSHSNQTPKRVP